MGAITLLGDEQASLVQDLTVRLVGAVELEQRRFIAGNSAQFQGDERDIVFLSMVDTPTGSPLALRRQDRDKQRYNVAASRAKDQMWLIHSLDPARDLKEGDLRRELIQHARDPGAKRRAREEAGRRAESPFELAIIDRLISRGFRVQPQVCIGNYRVDMLVGADGSQLVVECDGDRYHPPEKIPDDMRRQAVLERAGWRFVRLRGTRFYRDPGGSTEWLVQALERLGVRPDGGEAPSRPHGQEERAFRERIVSRAWEIMKDQGWIHMPPPEEQGSRLDSDDHPRP